MTEVVRMTVVRVVRGVRVVRKASVPQASVVEAEPEQELEPPEPYHFDPRRTGTGTASLL